jgi:hypothetical protein
MITLTLPSEDRRSLLRGFWLTLGTLLSAPWLALAWWFHSWALAAVAVAAAVLVGSIIFAREAFAWRVYRAWNRRLVRPFGQRAARLVMKVCFFIVFAAAGRAGSGAPFATSGADAAWRTRGALAAESYGSVFAAASHGASGAWVADYVSWARHTGNIWSLSLLPFLAVLRWLPLESERPAEANIYTLF